MKKLKSNLKLILRFATKANLAFPQLGKVMFVYPFLWHFLVQAAEHLIWKEEQFL